MVTIKRILCPVDFFPNSDTAAQYAADLATNFNATSHLGHAPMHVMPDGEQHSTGSRGARGHEGEAGQESTTRKARGLAVPAELRHNGGHGAAIRRRAVDHRRSE